MNKILQIKEALHEIPDARSKQGISHPFHGILALVLLGLIARQIYISHIVEWAKIYWDELKEPLGFKSAKPPDATTLFVVIGVMSGMNVFGRYWRRVSVGD